MTQRKVITNIKEIGSRPIDYVDVFDLCDKYNFLIEKGNIIIDTKNYDNFILSKESDNKASKCQIFMGSGDTDAWDFRLSDVGKSKTKIYLSTGKRNFLGNDKRSVTKKMLLGSRTEVIEG